jgi:hypothetical protein
MTTHLLPSCGGYLRRIAREKALGAKNGNSEGAEFTQR